MKSIHDPRYVEAISRMRAARERQGISQAELARRLGKPQSYVSKVETYERRMDFIEALDFCQALAIPLSALVPTELRRVLSERNTEH